MGKAWGSPELQGTFSLAVYYAGLAIQYTSGGVGGCNNVLWTAQDERCCYVDLRCGIQLGVGGWGGNHVVWKMSKMLLRWRCCYVGDVKDVATLKMLNMLLCWRCWRCWRCCYVEDVERVAVLKLLLHWKCCYVKDDLTLEMLKMLLR